MKYTEDRFTEEEKLAIESLAKVVCYFFDIDVEEVRGRGRQRVLTDARKIISNYAFNNIPVEHVQYRKSKGTTSLASWYLNVDHSSIVYFVNQCDELIQTDKYFSAIYDTIADAVNIQDVDGVTMADKIYKKRWDDIKGDIYESNHVKYDVIPEAVLTEIRVLYQKGYSNMTIANRHGTTMDFIEHVVKKENLMRSKKQVLINTARIMEARKMFNMNKSTKIDY